MARTNKYQNQKTATSDKIIAELSAVELTMADIENFQTTYGVSDIQLAKAIGVNRSMMSNWKSEAREMPPYIKIALFLAIKHIAQDNS